MGVEGIGSAKGTDARQNAHAGCFTSFSMTRRKSTHPDARLLLGIVGSIRQSERAIWPCPM